MLCMVYRLHHSLYGSTKHLHHITAFWSMLPPPPKKFLVSTIAVKNYAVYNWQLSAQNSLWPENNLQRLMCSAESSLLPIFSHPNERIGLSMRS